MWVTLYLSWIRMQWLKKGPTNHCNAKHWLKKLCDICTDDMNRTVFKITSCKVLCSIFMTQDQWASWEFVFWSSSKKSTATFQYDLWTTINIMALGYLLHWNIEGKSWVVCAKFLSRTNMGNLSYGIQASSRRQLWAELLIVFMHAGKNGAHKIYKSTCLGP